MKIRVCPEYKCVRGAGKKARAIDRERLGCNVEIS